MLHSLMNREDLNKDQEKRKIDAIFQEMEERRRQRKAKIDKELVEFADKRRGVV